MKTIGELSTTYASGRYKFMTQQQCLLLDISELRFFVQFYEIILAKVLEFCPVFDDVVDRFGYSMCYGYNRLFGTKPAPETVILVLVVRTFLLDRSPRNLNKQGSQVIPVHSCSTTASLSPALISRVRR